MRDRQIDRPTDRHTDRQNDREREREREGENNKQTVGPFSWIAPSQEVPVEVAASQQETLSTQDMQLAIGQIIDEHWDPMKLGVRWCFIANYRDLLRGLAGIDQSRGSRSGVWGVSCAIVARCTAYRRRLLYVA